MQMLKYQKSAFWCFWSAVDNISVVGIPVENLGVTRMKNTEVFQKLCVIKDVW